MVHHSFSVAKHATLETVYDLFQRQPYEYAGVVDSTGRLEGVISRGRLGFLLGARFGFAVYSRQAVSQHTLPNALTFRLGTPLETVLKTALDRSGDRFYDDVALVTNEGKYCGMMAVQKLVRLQQQLVEERTALAEGRQYELENKNLELERSLSALRESRGQFDNLFENSALAVALIDTNGTITAGNHRLWDLLADHEGKHSPDRLLHWMLERDRFSFLGAVAALMQSGIVDQKAEIEVGIDTPDRGQRRLLLFLSWIKETNQVCLLLDDVTEQRMLERRMVQQEKSALLENLAGGVAHEINNKLSPIVGFAELISRDLSRRTGPEHLVRYCQMIHDSAVESAQIIRQLLQLSRPGPIERAPTSLRKICEEALTMLSFRVRQLDCQIRWEFESNDLQVLADPSQIKQVVMNLGLNALDAMEKQRPAILTLRAINSGTMVRFSIIDCGQGIKAEHLPRIFNPFFTTKGPDKGTGLGLSVCESIVRQHGGEISVESMFGHGTKFSLTLPRPLKSTEPKRNFQSVAQGIEIKNGEGPNRRVLLADDELVIAKLMKETLTHNLGYTVELAANGQEAIERLERKEYDLIISDVRMPVVDGLGLFQWVKDHTPPMTKSFLFITGDAGSRELSLELERLGAPVLQKPFGIENLLEHCRSLSATKKQSLN